ncbi:MAG: hypothetical protein K2I03_08775 [Lachnospiraceae bacterium]|nr:hypothetical protein [Lachnospiraceae bacterium]
MGKRRFIKFTNMIHGAAYHAMNGMMMSEVLQTVRFAAKDQTHHMKHIVQLM